MVYVVCGGVPWYDRPLESNALYLIYLFNYRFITLRIILIYFVFSVCTKGCPGYEYNRLATDIIRLVKRLLVARELN